MASLSGSRLGRYKVGELIGVGGFAAVYEGRDEGLDADVAIKVLADHVSLDPEVRARFLNEGRLLRKVDHPGIVKVHDVGETEGLQPYLVLQKVAGGSLAERADRSQPEVNANDVRRMANMLSNALGALHGADIVHRDLSPSNVLIAGDGSDDRTSLLGSSEHLVLGDLGLAKDLSAHSGITSGGGTDGFAAPEQMQPASTVSTAADIYGASALVAHVVDLSNDQKMATRVRAAVRSGLAANPDERPATIEQWERLVVGAIDNRDAVGRTANRPRRSTMLIAVLALLVLIVVVSMGALVLRSRPSDITNLAIYDEKTHAPGWADDSWGALGRFDVPTGDAQLTGYDAVSASTVNPVILPDEHFIVVRLRNVSADANLGIRVNAADGTALDVCDVSGTDLAESNNGEVRIAVPGRLLGDYGGISRVSIMERGGSTVEFTLVELAIYDQLGDPPPSEANCR